MYNDTCRAYLAASFLLVSVFLVSAQDTVLHVVPPENSAAAPRFEVLSGELPALISFKVRPYLVTGDITVQPGVSVVVEPGVVFLFKNFTGLQIHGTFLAKGTAEKPIVFTSENDRTYAPEAPMKAAPYDWNGITIYENAFGTAFDWCTVQYSLFGINSLTQHLSIRSTGLQKNGKCDLTINGKQIDAAPQPFTWGYAGDTVSTALAKIAVEPPVETRKSTARLFLRFSSLPIVIGGLATGGWKTLDFQKSNKSLQYLNVFDNHANKSDAVMRWETARSERNSDLAWMIAGYGIGILGLTGFAISFAW